MSVVKLRLIHAMLLITEVAEKMQTQVRFTRLQGFLGFIINVNPVRKHVLYPFHHARSNRISIPFPPGKKLRK